MAAFIRFKNTGSQKSAPSIRNFSPTYLTHSPFASKPPHAMTKPQDPRYPLNWPFGWKRTQASDRKKSGFTEAATVTRFGYETVNGHYQRVGKDVRGTKTVSMRTACARLEDQLTRLGAEDVVLSTNVELTIGGEPRADRRAPDDPGAAVYFKLDGKERTLACDKWLSVPENICAIANHIDCLRRVERYGVGTLAQAFTGYDALPAPGADNRPAWRAILGFHPHSRVTPEDVNLNWRTLAKKDPNNEHRMLDLNLAREAALRELGVK